MLSRFSRLIDKSFKGKVISLSTLSVEVIILPLPDRSVDGNIRGGTAMQIKRKYYWNVSLVFCALFQKFQERVFDADALTCIRIFLNI